MVACPISAADFTGLIEQVPRVSLARLPTPLDDLPRLSRRLGGSRLFVKRDDLTGLALGGNKVRNFEFRMAEALQKKADHVIMFVDALSNSARQMVAAANQLGLRSTVILVGQKPARPTGNLLISYLLGAEIHFADSPEAQKHLAADIRDRYEAEGQSPFLLNESPMFAVGSALAYANATLEIMNQLEDYGITPEEVHLYMSSSGKGQAGLELAARALGLPTKITGVSATRCQAAQIVAQIVKEAAALLGLDLEIAPSMVDNRDEYVGSGYGRASKPGNDAMLLAAREEGLLLDPVYTGKAFAALLDDIRSGTLGAGEVGVFVHTGGQPMMFSFTEDIAAACGLPTQ